MDTVETGCHGKVRPVVHDEFDRVSKAAFEFAGVIQHLAGVAGFVAILQKRDAGGGEGLGGEKEGLRLGVKGGIENRIKVWESNGECLLQQDSIVRWRSEQRRSQ